MNLKSVALWGALAFSVSLSGQDAFADTRQDIRISAPWEISGPDPTTDGYIFLRMGVIETLIDTNQDGQLIAGLATNWTTSEDQLTWRFTIRDAQFHDRTPLTAQAVATSLERAAKQPSPFGRAPLNMISAGEGFVEITVKTPFAALPAVLAHSSTAIIASSSFDEKGKVIKAVGTGPFMVTDLAPPQKLETSRFEGYWGNHAKLQRASYLATKRAETRALLAESGDTDLVFGLDPAGYSRLSMLDDIATQSIAIPRVMLIKVNAQHPALKETAARQALSMAIDREGIAAGIIRKPESAATQVFPSALGDWYEASLSKLSFNVETAKNMLAELGWEAGEDGILVRDGERFALTLRTFPDRPELPLVATALQDQWRTIGVDLTVSVSNYSEIPAGHKDGSLDVALFARNYGVTADPIATITNDFGSEGGDWGAMNWNAPDVAEAVTTIAATADPEKRVPLIKTVVSRLHEDLPMIPVVWYQLTVGNNKQLEGIEIDPLERSYHLDQIQWKK